MRLCTGMSYLPSAQCSAVDEIIHSYGQVDGPTLKCRVCQWLSTSFKSDRTLLVNRDDVLFTGSDCILSTKYLKAFGSSDLFMAEF